jgi:hypothetical protein
MDRKEEKKEEQKQQSSHTSVRVLSERAQINAIHPDRQTDRQTAIHAGRKGVALFREHPKKEESGQAGLIADYLGRV